MTLHFIALGGKIMHALAITLHKKGYTITGSDDAFYDPSKRRLADYGLLPEAEGWFPEKITADTDAVILGMHAQKDNPELLHAQALGLPVYSFPAYIFEQSKDKKRVVIAGSHGKTTITSMVMHALQALQIDFDYMVGGEVAGFPLSVKLSPTAPILILEGDEYPASRIDLRPKFAHYRADLAVISGIAWDHVNIYPTFESYLSVFEGLAQSLPLEGKLVWNAEDATLQDMMQNMDEIAADTQTYRIPDYEIDEDGQTALLLEDKLFPLQVFGRHNLSNLSAAQVVCAELGVSKAAFYEAMQTFAGAGMRLEVLHHNKTTASTLFRDYAHAPSKWQATTEAVAEQFPDQPLTAVLELHTYSSLDPAFFHAFAGTLDAATRVVIFCQAANIQRKQRKVPQLAELQAAFGRQDLVLLQSQEELTQWLAEENYQSGQWLFMSSGNFDNFDFSTLKPQVDEAT